MDAAQMITRAVVPGTAALPASAETSSGASATSPLFREMFSKAALAAGTPLEQQTPGAHALTPEQRGFFLHKGHENKGEVKADLSEGQLEAELLSGAEILLTSDVSTQENNVGGSETGGSTQEIPRHTRAEVAGDPAFTMQPAGLVSVPVALPLVRNVSHGFAAERHGNSALPVLPETASAVAEAVTESVRGTFSAVPVADAAQLEQRPVGVEGAADQFLRQLGFAAGAGEKKLVSLVQPETSGPKNFPGKGGNTPSAATEFTSVAAEVAGDTKTAGNAELSSTPDLKEGAEVVPGGVKMVGKDHGNVAHHENVPAMKQAQQEQKIAGQGETVMRELPRGVTVLNPAQTLTMGRPAMTADAAPLAVQGTERGRIFPQDGEAREEQGRQLSLAGEAEKIVRNTEGFSSQNNSNLGHDSSSNGGNHALPQTAAASGSFDAVVKGQLEPLSEVPREHEVSELHESILSQVREKLVNQDHGTVSKIRLKLNPHDLGELQINVRLEDQKMRVDITAQNPVVKEALLQNIDQLKDSLMRQNISMERFHVSTGDGQGQAFNQSFREGRQTAQQTPDTFTYPLSGYYQEDTQVNQATYADSRENSLVDMRF
ncbi:MAG: flagellar hook-length control protein FliK [Geobacteraceae bacterium]